MSRPLVLPILAIDLGTHTGWAMRDRWGVVTSGSQSFELSRWEGYGVRLLRFRKWVREMIDEHLLAGGKPGEEAVVVYERPIEYSRGKRGKSSGSEISHQLVGALLPELEDRGLHHEAPTPSEVKKASAGKGNANKEAMAHAAEETWEHYTIPDDFDPKKGDDEADALGVLTWAINETWNAGPPGYNP